MIKLVIFDLDGTLMDAYAAVERSMNYTMRKMGLPLLDYKIIRRSVGWGDSQLLKRFIGEDYYQKGLSIYRPHHAKALKTGTILLPGAKTLLNTLKKGKFRMAIASNRPTPYSLIAIRHLKIQKYFDYVLCADKVKKGKPSPIILRAILKKFSLKPSEALYIGDMDVDMIAGQRARIKTIAVTTGSCSRKELKKFKPWKILSNLVPVPKLMANINHQGNFS